MHVNQRVLRHCLAFGQQPGTKDDNRQTRSHPDQKKCNLQNDQSAYQEVFASCFVDQEVPFI
jgi:hypothetical protein